MMPIVDACVALSHDDYTLNDYLSDANGFHVLRMVAVQHAPLSSSGLSQAASSSFVKTDIKQYLEDAKSLQLQATTRGSGGLPNGIVAYTDLSDATFIQDLLACDEMPNLRGVHQELKSDAGFSTEDANELLAAWAESIALIARAKLSIDISASIASSQVLEAFADAYPDVDLIVNLVIDANEGCHDLEQWASLLPKLAKHTRVYLKLSCTSIGLHFPKSSKAAEFKAFLTCAISIIGAERIMFASGLNGSLDSATFRLQWDEFVSAAAQLSARQRDMVIRRNAIGVYRL